MRLVDSIRVATFVVFTAFTIGCTNDLKKPTVLIAILVRNKAHTLPYFLTFIEELNYPKERIHLWIRSDNNVDKSIEILSTWLNNQGSKYHGIKIHLDKESSGFEDENEIVHWSAQRFLHMINLREEALNEGRNMWADFVWLLDADVFLTNPNTLDELISKNETVVAPLLKSDGLYSNFWAGMTNDYYYLRTEKYEPILYREERGCFNVPMIHSAVLINLRKHLSDRLTYDPKNLNEYDGPTDDIITFAVGANKSGALNHSASYKPGSTVFPLFHVLTNSFLLRIHDIGVPLFVCNDNVYGFVMVPLEEGETITEDKQRLINIKTEILANDNYLPLSKYLEQYVQYPAEDTLELDNIYMINLLRRPERRDRMHKLFKELGLRVETVDAVDGRALNQSFLESFGIEMMPEYTDPYHQRPMTMGEVGCFLSHYVIWNEVIKSGFESVIVLEDDVRFEPYFRQKVKYILKESNDLRLKWDLIYLGRKRLVENAESRVDGSKYLVHAAYSYWTLGYILSASGARKLVEALPLKKLIPVDEYLPILSNTHPREEWKIHYPKRNLIILSANPLLIYPTHYTGEQGYISDTEDSTTVSGKQNTIKIKREDL